MSREAEPASESRMKVRRGFGVMEEQRGSAVFCGAAEALRSRAGGRSIRVVPPDIHHPVPRRADAGTGCFFIPGIGRFRFSRTQRRESLAFSPGPDSKPVHGRGRPIFVRDKTAGRAHSRERPAMPRDSTANRRIAGKGQSSSGDRTASRARRMER